MPWTPRYVNGLLSIVPDESEDFAERAIFDRLRDIEISIGTLVESAEKGKFETREMLRVFGKITGLFGGTDFVLRSGPPDPVAGAALEAKMAEMLALDRKLNAELDERRNAATGKAQ